MAKKKIESPQMADELTGIKPEGWVCDIEKATFWEWKTQIEKLLHAKTKAALAGVETKVAMLEFEMARRAANDKRMAQIDVSEHLKIEEKNYGLLKSKIEGELGVSLNETVITDNYEILKPSQKDTK